MKESLAVKLNHAGSLAHLIQKHLSKEPVTHGVVCAVATASILETALIEISRMALELESRKEQCGDSFAEDLTEISNDGEAAA